MKLKKTLARFDPGSAESTHHRRHAFRQVVAGE
jgi:hypothetical protein